MIRSRQDLLNKNSYENWCCLIAWLLNCDSLKFYKVPRHRTAEDIWKSNSNGELIFVGESIRYLIHILEQIIEQKDLGEIEPLMDNIFKILEGEEIEPDAKYATGFGLKCQTILWKCEESFKNQVDKLLIDAWGGKK